MSVDQPGLEQMSRDELVETVESLRERVGQLESIVDIRGDPENADLEDIWIAGVPIGMMLRSRQKMEDAQNEYLFGVAGVDVDTVRSEATDEPLLDRIQTGEAGGQTPEVDRSRMRAAHRMWEDYKTGEKTALQKTQRRVAVLMGQFVDRCVHDESTEVDASGQLYTLNSTQAQDALDEYDELDGVGEASKSTVVARVMRDVQRMTKEEDCDCEEIDGCNHGLVEFRPGKPHVLTVQKKKFLAVMQYAYDTRDGIAEGTRADDSSEQDDEAQVSSEMDQLTQAGREAGR